MRSRVYERSRVRLSVPLINSGSSVQWVCSWAPCRQEVQICSRCWCPAQWHRSMVCSSTCGQCHVHSWGMRLSRVVSEVTTLWRYTNLFISISLLVLLLLLLLFTWQVSDDRQTACAVRSADNHWHVVRQSTWWLCLSHQAYLSFCSRMHVIF